MGIQIYAASLAAETAEKRQLQPIYLHADEATVLHALKTVAQVGVCGLHLFQHVFPERFSILGIRQKLIELRTRLYFIVHGSTELDVRWGMFVNRNRRNGNP